MKDRGEPTPFYRTLSRRDLLKALAFGSLSLALGVGQTACRNQSEADQPSQTLTLKTVGGQEFTICQPSEKPTLILNLRTDSFTRGRIEESLAAIDKLNQK